MEIRESDADDVDDVREIATRSMEASYTPAIDDEVLSGAIDRWYDEHALTGAATDENTVLLLAVDDEPVGFAKGATVDRREPIGEIHWLHVHPDHRGAGVGERLLEATEEALVERGALRLTGLVLSVNEAGTEFYEAHGYESAGEREVDIGGQTFVEREYSKRTAEADVDAGTDDHPAVRELTTPDGETRHVVYEESEQGSDGPFYPIYSTEERSEEDLWGWFCGNCESTDVSMNTMGRMECGDCGNARKPPRWDAAYL